jgi:hypothetical protein
MVNNKKRREPQKCNPIHDALLRLFKEHAPNHEICGADIYIPKTDNPLIVWYNIRSPKTEWIFNLLKIEDARTLLMFHLDDYFSYNEVLAIKKEHIRKILDRADFEDNVCCACSEIVGQVPMCRNCAN